MKIYRYEHTAEFFSSNILNQYFKDMKLGIFDIETLGLNPALAPMILGGLMSVSPSGSCRMTQYFAEKPKDEKELLLALREDLNKFDYILTFNGKHFDMPYIQKRAQLLGIEDFYIRPHNLDLYLVLHGHSQLRLVLGSLKQKNLETYMGLAPSRYDEITGKESVAMYYAYLDAFDSNEKKDLQKKILLHNHDDVLQLYKILPVILQADTHKAFAALGFPVAGSYGWPQLNLSFVKVNGGELVFSGTYSGEPFMYSNYSSAERPYDCHFTFDRSFSFALPLQQLKGSSFFNLKSYFQNLSDFEAYGGFVNGFLILSQNNKPNYLECNMLVKKLLTKFMAENPKGE